MFFLIYYRIAVCKPKFEKDIIWSAWIYYLLAHMTTTLQTNVAEPLSASFATQKEILVHRVH